MKLSIAQLEDRLQDLSKDLDNLDKTNYKSAKIYRRQIRETRQELKKARLKALQHNIWIDAEHPIY